MYINSKTLKRELNLFLSTCWLSGLHPFTPSHKFSSFLFIYSIGCVCFTGSLIHYKAEMLFDMDTVFTYKLLLVLNTGSIFGAQIICIIESILNRKKYIIIFKNLDVVDCTLDEFGPGDRVHYFSLLGVVFVQLCLNVIHYLASTYTLFIFPILDVLGLYVSYAIPITLLYTENKIRSMFNLILWRLKRLNACTESILSRSVSSKVPTLENFQNSRKIDVLLDMFEKLYENYIIVRENYSKVLLMITTNILVIVVSTTYYCASDIRWLVKDSDLFALEPRDLLAVIIQYSWTLIRFAELLLIVRTCVHISDQVIYHIFFFI